MAKMKKRLKKSSWHNWILVFISVSVVILFLVLVCIEMNNTRVKILQSYSQKNEEYLKLLIQNSEELAESSGENLDDVLKRQIRDNFLVSASSFMIASKNDEIFWVMDEEITNSYLGGSLLKFWEDSKREKDRTGNFFRVTLEEENYVVTQTEISDYDNNKITIAIIEKNEYLIKHIFFDTLQIHIVIYFVLLGISFLTIIIYLVYREIDNVKEIEQLKKDSTTDRLQIEQLEDRMFLDSQKERTGESIFFPLELVEEVIEKLSKEQRRNSIRIVIKAKDVDEKALMQLAVMIERMKVKKCLSCFLGEKTFLILLLNRNEHTAESFVQQLFAQYELNFGTDIFHVDYVIEPLEKEEHNAV